MVGLATQVRAYRSRSVLMLSSVAMRQWQAARLLWCSWQLSAGLGCSEQETRDPTVAPRPDAALTDGAEQALDAGLLRDAAAPARTYEDGGEASEGGVGIYETECGAYSSEQIIGGLARRMTLIMVDAHALDGPMDFVERNENGTLTTPSFRVRFESATMLDGSAWELDGEVVATVAGETRYEDPDGNVFESMPCGATDPTVTHQLLGLDGSPAALVLERFEEQDVYFVRAALGYVPETETVALPDGDISLEELEQRVATARSERGL